MLGSLAPIGQAQAQSQTRVWDPHAAAQLDADVLELPDQIQPPAPGDTEWPYYNQTIKGERYSALHEINESNVDALEETCRVRLSGLGPLSSGAIVVKGALYLTAGRATLAIEPTNCDIAWKSLYNPDETEIYNANRGVAYSNGKLFRGTGDARVVAYDAGTGRELWRTKFGDPTNGEYADSAPVVWDGKVMLGLAPGDLGITGRVAAFDANDGKLIWSFNTIPHPGEFGSDTWPGDTWKTGGGGTWSSFALDPETSEFFVPVANPAPDFDPGARKGDNLFTSSVLVLDPHTGKRLWHFQTRPSDNHDYGDTAAPILLDVDGRRAVAQGSKDGFVYLIDRKSHTLIWRAAATTILNHTADATVGGIRVCPGAKGGIEYSSPAYDPDRKLVLVGAVDWCYSLFKQAYPPHQPGQPFFGGKMDRGDENPTGWISAIDVKTGKVKWRYHTPAPVISAITPTAGGITFAGDASGILYVFRTEDGKLLRQIQTGGAMAGGVITYQIRNHQYLAIESGNISRSSWTKVSGIPTLIVYRLPQQVGATEADLSTLTPDPAHGGRVYRTVCTTCHGTYGQGQAGVPNLQGLGNRYTQDQAVAFIQNPKKPMPKLYPDALTAQDVVDVAAYVRTLKVAAQ
jgi:PQQ-dependent dehydrogenase (methanol/ethanol family)